MKFISVRAAREAGAADRDQRQLAHREQSVNDDQQQDDKDFEADMHGFPYHGVDFWSARAVAHTIAGKK